MKKYIFANWKANPLTFVEAKKLLGEYLKIDRKKADIIVCPPASFIFGLKNKKIKIGAQDVSCFLNGSHTGEVTAPMLKSIGVSYCIVGHSERRKKGETDEVVAEKLKLLLKNKITPILCVGEKQRGGDGEHFNEITNMLLSAIKDVPKKMITNIVIAYEPVWAISTEKNGAITPEILNESLIFIKKILNDFAGKQIASKVLIIYGGSVDAKVVKIAL